MAKRTAEYDIYTQSGAFVETELENPGFPWTSKKFFITIGFTLLLFGILVIPSWFVVGIFGFPPIIHTIATLIMSGTFTYLAFVAILNAGDGTVIHRANAGEAEVISFYDMTLIPDKYGGGFSLLAYGPDLAFKYPGTRLEGTVDLSTKYIIRGVEGNKDNESSFSVSFGSRKKAEDEILIDVICSLRRTIRYAYVTYIATRGLDDIERYIDETIRSLINNVLDRASIRYSKEDLLADRFGEFKELAGSIFRESFYKLQMSDPVFRGLALMKTDGIIISNARENDEVAKARSKKTANKLLSEGIDEAAQKKVTEAAQRNERLSFEDAVEQVHVDLGIVRKTDSKYEFGDKTIDGVLALLNILKGGSQ